MPSLSVLVNGTTLSLVQTGSNLFSASIFYILKLSTSSFSGRFKRGARVSVERSNFLQAFRRSSSECF